jgi:acryloyl-coenzyme A reductase
MRALVLNSDLHISDAELPSPEPLEGHVVVRVGAAGVCHHDALIMAGILRRGIRFPLVLGHEAYGTVEALGPGVAESWLGARVTFLPALLGHVVDGCFAELVGVPVTSLVRVPPEVPDETAAVLACPAGVAVKAVEQVGGVRKGETVAVTGVSGGLGSTAAQIAHAAGAHVIGVTYSEAKVSQLEGQPWLDAVVVQGDVPLADMLRALSGDEGVDLFVDTVGRDIGPAVSSLVPGGRVVLLGQVAGESSEISPAEMVFREAQVLGSLGVGMANVERALELTALGKITPAVDRVMAMTAESLAFACKLIRERALMGRIVLKP